MLFSPKQTEMLLTSVCCIADCLLCEREHPVTHRARDLMQTLLRNCSLALYLRRIQETLDTIRRAVTVMPNTTASDLTTSHPAAGSGAPGTADSASVRSSTLHPSSVRARVRVGLGSGEPTISTQASMPSQQERGKISLSAVAIDEHRIIERRPFSGGKQLAGGNTGGDVFRHRASLPYHTLTKKTFNGARAADHTSPSPAAFAAVVAALAAVEADATGDGVNEASARTKRVDGRLGPRLVRVARLPADLPKHADRSIASSLAPVGPPLLVTPQADPVHLNHHSVHGQREESSPLSASLASAKVPFELGSGQAELRERLRGLRRRAAP